tara:strand:- start:480 stop:671 length:192 start_codon:yes stop_codon:yes gene_type:complete
MNNFEMVFGTPSPTDAHTGIMPIGVILTPQGTFKAIVKRKYLGTFKEIEQAINAVTEHLNKSQ